MYSIMYFLSLCVTVLETKIIHRDTPHKYHKYCSAHNFLAYLELLFRSASPWINNQTDECYLRVIFSLHVLKMYRAVGQAQEPFEKIGNMYSSPSLISPPYLLRNHGNVGRMAFDERDKYMCTSKYTDSDSSKDLWPYQRGWPVLRVAIKRGTTVVTEPWQIGYTCTCKIKVSWDDPCKAIQ